MITSSKFFDKSFFTLENTEQRSPHDELSPWENFNNQIAIPRSRKAVPIEPTRETNKGYELSKISSKRYVEQKLRAKSLLQNNKELEVKKPEEKFFRLQQKMASHEHKKSEQNRSYELSPERIIRRKRSKNLFPELSLHQYQLLRAEGSGIYASSSIDEILEKRKCRRKILEDFGRNRVENRRKSPNLVNISAECRELFNGKYVCALRSPQFSVHGLPTHKLTIG